MCIRDSHALQALDARRRAPRRVPGPAPGCPAHRGDDHDPGLVLPDSGHRAEPERARVPARHLPLLRSVAGRDPVPRRADPGVPDALRLDHAGRPPGVLRLIGASPATVEAGGDPPADLLSLLAGDVVDAARGLLGVWLVRGDAASLRIGRIVETEAYGGPEDLASHARFGHTPRNRSMFGPPGHAYVYGVYGTVCCVNVVTGQPGIASAVLLRGAVPLTGAD